MVDLKNFRLKLRENLNILQEREPKYGGNPPLELLNQIDDHKKAIALTEQAIAGELTETEWREAIRPLLIVQPDAQTIETLIGSLIGRTPLMYRQRIENLIEHYALVFGGRQAELIKLDAWLDDPEKPFAFLMAPAGRGKTALLVHWLLQLQKERAEKLAVIFHPISLRFETATAEVALRSLTGQLASLHHRPPPHPQSSLHELREIFAEYLRRNPPDDWQLLLIIDALDEASGWQFGPDLFPQTPPKGLKILCSARELADEALEDWLFTLGWPKSNTRTWDNFLSRLDRQAIMEILQKMGNPLTSWNRDTDWVGKLQAVSEGDPLVLRLYIEALKHNELSPEQLMIQPPGLNAYLRHWGKQLAAAGNTKPARDLLGCCAVAVGPLSAKDLTKLCPKTLADELDQAVEQVARFIIGAGTAEQGYVFSHPLLAEAFARRLKTKRSVFEQKFLAYGKRTLAALKKKGLEPKNVSPYLLQFYRLHLAGAGLAKEIPALICYEWMKAWEWFEGGYLGFLKDVDHAWQLAIERRDFAAQVRYALIKASVNSMAANIPSELLVRGIKENIISIPQALLYLEQVSDEAERQAVLARLETKLSPHLAQSSKPEKTQDEMDEWQMWAARRKEILNENGGKISQAFLAEELDFLEAYVKRVEVPVGITGKGYVSEVARGKIVRLFEDLEPYLPTDLFSRGLQIAFRLDLKTRAAILEVLTPNLSSVDSEWLWMACINTKTKLDVSDDENRLRLILDLVPHLPPHSKHQALQVALSNAQVILTQLELSSFKYEVEYNQRRSKTIIDNICFCQMKTAPLYNRK